ncbi:hypothetical protein DPF89_03358 [Salmonella enterica subsp. enterica serovar Napoli]|nr:hypothetical protein DPF89_03358 [Salmonella enterica subsp. enterica serovar Napoli]
MALRTKVKYGLSAAMLALIAAGASAPHGHLSLSHLK